MTTQPLSSNPALTDYLAGVLDFRLSKFLQGTDDQLPAVVIAYNRTTNRAQVKPLIQMVTTNGTLISRAEVMSVPVYRFGAGGGVLSFNLVQGNLGWIKANDRDISLFKQTYAETPPNTKRKHNFSDAMFYPDVMTGVTIAAEDAGNAVFQTIDGVVRVALWPTQAKITAPKTAITDQPGYANSPNAVLDVQSITKAFKLPSMTTAQRDAIPSPVGGFAVYVNDFSPTPKVSFYIQGVGWS